MRGPRISALLASLAVAGTVGLAGQQSPPPPAVPPAGPPPSTQQPPASQPQEPRPPLPPKPAAPAPPSQVFRGGVELVSLNVTVMDGAK